MYPFRQSIGIYYEDEEWALEIYNAIIKEKEAVEKSIRSKNSWYIVFKDGSLVRFLKYNILWQEALDIRKPIFKIKI